MRFPQRLIRTLLSGSRPQPLATPRLADGVELLGAYKDSGFREAPYLVRAADGQVVQLTRLLHLVAAACNGSRDVAEIGRLVGEQFGRTVTADNVVYLVERKLAPMGLVAGPRSAAAPPRAAAPLAFTWRRAVLPPRVVNRVAAIFAPLFRPTAVGAVLAWLVVLDCWLFSRGGVGEGLRQTLSRPALLLAVFGLVILGTAFHELGHAAACRYGGATPGAIGAGLYLVWPAFYTDVTDAYRLDRRGRLRTDLGGIHFNAVFALGLSAVYFATGFAPLLFVVFLEHVLAFQQLVPWIRLDGYYILSDLAGVPDMLSRVKPTLLSLVPGRPLDPRVAELKPWVRKLVVAYVATVVPALAAAYILLVLNVPRFVEQTQRSWMLEFARAAAAWRTEDAAALTLAVLGIVAVALPALGLALIAVKTARVVGVLLARAALGRPRLRAAALLVGTAAAFAGGVAFAGFLGAWSERTAVGAPAKARQAASVRGPAGGPVARPRVVRPRRARPPQPHPSLTVPRPIPLRAPALPSEPLRRGRPATAAGTTEAATAAATTAGTAATPPTTTSPTTTDVPTTSPPTTTSPATTAEPTTATPPPPPTESIPPTTTDSMTTIDEGS